MPLEIIPTCTGNTQSGRLTSKFKWDHPRTCGEHSTVTISPLLSVGSSPHVRGAHGAESAQSAGHGIIPACAGSTHDYRQGSWNARDHPRMCGEHRRPLCRWSGTRGSSPHVRGALGRSPASSAKQGIIPACAGSTSWSRPRCTGRWDHPRMCGEHAMSKGEITADEGSSPHVRGAPCFMISPC